MSYEKKILEVKEAVEEAIRLIRARHPGANLDEARRLLSEAGKALKEDRFEEAIALAKKAQLAANPTTEYLLSNAKELATSAERSFSAKKYEEAVGLWKKALEEYARAGELAKARDEQEIFTRISEVESKIRENISKAEITADNRKMLSFVDEGNKLVEEANKLFEARSYDESKGSYEKAKKAFEEALEIARKRNFADDEKTIGEALNSIETSIESTLLNKGDAILRGAEENVQQGKLTEAEQAFSSALKYLESIEIARKEELERMREKGREGLIRAKTEQGRKLVQDAENLFKEKKYYDAKEAYKAARDFFERVVDEASRYRLPRLVEELNDLVQFCGQNMTAATTALMDVEGVEPEIIPIDRIARGMADFRAGLRQPVPPAVERLRDKYDDLAYIGGGGFGDVYKAKRKSDGVSVAVKVPRTLDAKGEKGFFRELRAWEKLNHRNIVRLIEPHLRPVPHLELEYVDGPSLDDATMKESFSVEEACRIAFDIASGLQYAHNMSVIHGDVTPNNVLLSKIGEAKITDFGLAKIATSGSPGRRDYTLQYAPLDLIETEIPTEKTDVYQLALTFYCILTGGNPFDAEDVPEILKRIRSHTPDPPSKYNSRVSELDDLVMRCLSRNPNERPSVREFRESIYEFVKRNYHYSLSLTPDIPRILKVSCDSAFMAAKNEDAKTCLEALKLAKDQVRDPETRKETENLIDEIEMRAQHEMDLNPLLNNIEMLLRKMQREG